MYVCMYKNIHIYVHTHIYMHKCTHLFDCFSASVLEVTLNNLMVRVQWCWNFGECGVPLIAIAL